MVGGDEHAGCQEVRQAADAERAVRQAVGPSAADLEPRGGVVETVDHDLVVAAPGGEDVVEGKVVVADDAPRAADTKGRTGAGDEGLFASGDEVAQEPDGLDLATAEFDFGVGDGIAVGRADGHLIVEFEEHQIVVVDAGGDQRQADRVGAADEFGRETPGIGVEADDASVAAAAAAFGELGDGPVGEEEVVVALHAGAGDADAVGDGVIVRLGELRAGVGGEVAVARGVHESAGVEGLASGSAFGDDGLEGAAATDGADETGVQGKDDAGLAQHPEGDEFVEFDVNGGADGIVVEALEHFGVPGRAADRVEAVNDFLWDAADNLAFFDAGEGPPKVVETMEGGAALDGNASGVTFHFDKNGFGTEARGGECSNNAGGASPGHDDVKVARGEPSGGFIVADRSHGGLR